jgi:hypothetical protein
MALTNLSRGLAEMERDLASDEAVGLDNAEGLQEGMGTDGLWTDSHGGMMGPLHKEGDKEPTGFFRSWIRYRRRLAKDLPIVKEGEFKNIWKIPYYHFLSKFWNYVNIEESSRTGIIPIMWGTLADTLTKDYRETAKQNANNIFPRVRTWITHAEGATTVQGLYVYDYMGYDIPVAASYTKADSDKIVKPDENTIREGMKEVEDHHRSPFNDTETAKEYHNPDFITYSASKVTRWDYKRYMDQDPARFFRWLFKPETWFIHQRGQRDLQEEGNLPADLQGKIKIYKKPVGKTGLFYDVGKFMADDSPRSSQMFWYTLAIDLMYDFVDTFYDPLEDLMEKLKLPEESIRELVFYEWKVATNNIRHLYRSGPRPLTYEF